MTLTQAAIQGVNIMEPPDEHRPVSLGDAVDAARRAVEAGDLRRAYATLAPFEIRVDETPAFAFFQASIALALQRWAEALPVFNALRGAMPDEQFAHLNYASCLIGLGRIEEAEAVLRSPLLPDAECPSRYALLARIAARRGDEAGVRGMIRRALGSNADERILDEVLKRPLIAALIRDDNPPRADRGARRLN